MAERQPQVGDEIIVIKSNWPWFVAGDKGVVRKIINIGVEPSLSVEWDNGIIMTPYIRRFNEGALGFVNEEVDEWAEDFIIGAADV